MASKPTLDGGESDDQIVVPRGQADLVLALGGSVSAGVEAEQGALEFGFSVTARAASRPPTIRPFPSRPLSAKPSKPPSGALPSPAPSPT